MRTVGLMNAAALLAALASAALLLFAGARWSRRGRRSISSASKCAAICSMYRRHRSALRSRTVERQLLHDAAGRGASTARNGALGRAGLGPARVAKPPVDHSARTPRTGRLGDGRLLSDNGVLFIANVAEAEIFGPLPEFSGPDAEARTIAARYYEFAVLIAPLSLAIDAIDVSERRSWTLQASGPACPPRHWNSAATIRRGRCSDASATWWRRIR